MTTRSNEAIEAEADISPPSIKRRKGCVKIETYGKRNQSSSLNIAKKRTRAAQPYDAFKCENCGRALGWLEPRLCDKCRAAQPQEWTADFVRDLAFNHKGDGDEAIAAAHNATIRK